MMKKRRKPFFIVFVLLWILVCISILPAEAATKKTKKAPGKITLNYKKQNLSVGDTLTLKVKKVTPKDASKAVSWSSSNKKIATVSGKGKVKAKKSGSVTITAKSKENKKIVAKCKIKVYKATKKVKLLTKKSYVLTVGQTQKLGAVVTKPAKGAAPITWSSSCEKVAKVNKKGMVTAVSQGETTIYAKSGKKKVKTKIVVIEMEEEARQEEHFQEDVSPKEPEVASGMEGETNPEGGKESGTEDSPEGGKESGTEDSPEGGKESGTEDSPEGGKESGIEDNPESGEEQEPQVEVAYSGMQDGISWTIDSNGKLTISGTCTQENSAEKQLPQWSEYGECITTAVVTAKQVKSTYGWFYGCYNLSSVDFSEFQTQDVTDMASMFMGCSSLRKIEVEQFDTSKVTDMSCMFAGCSKLTSVNVKEFDTSKVTDMSGMFWLCSSLAYIHTRDFDTQNVRNMKSMFENCSSLTSLDMTGFQTSHVTDLSFMFSGCSQLTELDVSAFDTEQVTSMRGMFQGCSSLASINVDGFDTAKVTDMAYMFSRCKKLTKVNVNGFDKSQVLNQEFMFQGCENFQ